jgi:hypothetical protein
MAPDEEDICPAEEPLSLARTSPQSCLATPNLEMEVLADLHLMRVGVAVGYAE